MPRKKPDGIQTLINEFDPPIEDLTLRDFFAAFALLSGANATEAYDTADDMIQERKIKPK